MLIRSINRKDGNSSQFCCPLAQVEDAAEKSENLRKTIYKEGSAHHNLCQNLVLDKYHAILVEATSPDSEVQVETAIVQICETKDKLDLLSDVNVTLVRGPDLETFAIHDEEDAEAPSFKLPIQEEMELKVHVVPTLRTDEDDDDDEADADDEEEDEGDALRDKPKYYDGFHLRDGDRTLMEFCFLNSMVVPDGGKSLDLKCLQIEGFPAHDTKHGWVVSGMSPTHACTSNCLVCISTNAHYKVNAPEWMVKYVTDNRPADLEFLESTGQCDPPLRTGQYTVLESEKRYTRIWSRTARSSTPRQKARL
jgi:hypothetical protein